jgi:uncharacterized membrane protein
MNSKHENSITGLNSNALMASLSYVGVLVLIPVIAGAKKDSFVTFHLKQGLVIFVGEILAVIMAQWTSSIGSLLFLLLFIASIVGFFYAIHGDKWSIPIIGSVANMFTI